MSLLLLDEMLSPSIAVGLRDLDHDVRAVVEEPDLRGISDADVLERATSEHRVVVTLNIGDFAALDKIWRSQGRTHAGLLMVSTSSYPQDRRFIGRVIAAVDRRANTGAMPAGGAVEFL